MSRLINGKAFTFDDIEEASDQSSDLEIQQPPPPPLPIPDEVVKREIIEIPVIYESPKFTKQQKIYYQPQEVQFDDFDIDEAAFVPEFIDIPHQEEVIQPIVQQQVQEPENDYMDDDVFHYRHEFLEDDFPIQHLDKEQDDSLTSKKESKIPIKYVSSKRYNPKMCAVYLKLQGKEALLGKFQPPINLEESQEEHNEPDEALEDLEVIGTFVRGLTKKKETPQPLPLPSSSQSKSKSRTQQVGNASPQAVQIMQSSIQQMKEKILLKQQQQKEREERLQQQQKQKQLLKLAQMKQVIQILAKKIDKKIILYKARLTQKQKESTSWLRFSELALIAKGIEEIYHFEKRMADKYFHQYTNKSTYMSHRISDGKIIDSCRIYAQPIPVKKQEEQEEEEKPKRSALLKLAQQKQKENLELEKQIREQLEQKELDKIKKKEDLKIKQKEFEFDQEYDMLDCDKIQIFKIVSDRVQRLEKRFEQKLEEALQVIPEQTKIISSKPKHDPVKKQTLAKQSNNKKQRREDKYSDSRLEGDKKLRKGWISTKREYMIDSNKKDKKRRVIESSESEVLPKKRVKS